MRKKLFVWATAVICLLGVLPVNAVASEFKFAVVPVIPENQIDKTKTYFDLKMNPGAEQDLEVQLRNDTEKEVIVETGISSATTNLNGVVEYSPNEKKTDSSLKYNMADLVVAPTETKLPAKGEATIKIHIAMPKEQFDGVLAGGITFTEKQSDEKESKDSSGSGMAIKNKYSYVVALLARQNENEVTPELLLNSVAAAQVNARNVINANLQNPQATYINQLNLTAEITKKGETDVLYVAEGEGLQMAPNSNFDYPVPLNGKPLEAGEYHLEIVAYGGKSPDGTYKVKNADGKEIAFKYKWELGKDFTISGAEAKKYNEQDVTIKKDNTWLYILIGIGLLVAALLLIFFLIRRKKKKKAVDEMRKKKAAKRRKKKKQTGNQVG